MTIHACGRALARINGRTYKEALREIGDDLRKVHRDQLTDWVVVCPHCDRHTLAATRQLAWPFLDADGVMRTVHDYEDLELSEGSEVLDLGGFVFSRNAFESAMLLALKGDPTTPTIEAMGRDFLIHPSPVGGRKFCEEVCNWGRGQRVFGNLDRFHGAALGRLVHDWLVDAQNLEAREAIETGIQIRGFGVSFASKHLRLLQPDRFPVLDEVLEAGLGVARNPAGYQLLTRMLSEFKQAHRIQEPIAAVESGIFLLVRQVVRATRSV